MYSLLYIETLINQINSVLIRLIMDIFPFIIFNSKTLKKCPTMVKMTGFNNITIINICFPHWQKWIED